MSGILPRRFFYSIDLVNLISFRIKKRKSPIDNYRDFRFDDKITTMTILSKKMYAKKIMN